MICQKACVPNLDYVDLKTSDLQTYVLRSVHVLTDLVKAQQGYEK